MNLVGRIVDFEMVGQGALRVRYAVLPGPEDLLPFFLRNLGPGEENDGFLQVISVPDLELNVSDFNVNPGIKALERRDGYLAQPRSAPKRGGKTREDGGIFGIVKIEVCADVGEMINGPRGFFDLLGFGGGEFSTGGEESLELVVINVPLGPVYQVPCADAVYEVFYGASTVDSDESGDKTGQDVRVNRGAVVLFNILGITEQMEGEETGSVCTSCVGGVGLFQSLPYSLEVLLPEIGGSSVQVEGVSGIQRFPAVNTFGCRAIGTKHRQS